MSRIRAWAAQGAGQTLAPFEYDPGPLAADEVEVAVENCGICHSDLSVLHNEWMNSIYPVVPGHEVVGRSAACPARPSVPPPPSLPCSTSPLATISHDRSSASR